MNRNINCQQLKGLLFTKALLALVLAAPGVAVAAGSGTATLDDIKNTNYPIPAGAYYVAPDGKDTNTGNSPNSPMSVAKAVQSAPAGSTIVFRGGTYRNVETDITKKLTLQAYPHEKPMLKGSIEVTGWVADGSTWRKDGWNYAFAPNVGSEYIDPNYPMAGYRDMTFIDGVSLKQVASKAAVVPGTFYVDYANKQLHIGDNPAGKTVEATALEEAFDIVKTRTFDPSNTVVRGLGFAHYAENGIGLLKTSDVTLENNTFVWNGIRGVHFQYLATDATVRGNIFSYNGMHGIRGTWAHNMLLEDNTLSYNGIERFSKTWSAAGIKVIFSDGVVWRRNLVESNFGTGMWLDASSTNATVVNNTVRSNESMGVFFELSHKAIIANNVIHHNHVGVMIADSSRARVYNNTMSMNRYQIIAKDSRRKNTDPKEIAAGITWVTHSNVFKNNILSNATGSSLLQASDCSTFQSSASMIADIDYNAYYDTSSSKDLIKWSLGRSNCSLNYSSLSAFKSATGFEQHGLFGGNSATNPFFVDETNGDYRLKQGSPAIGGGQALPADIAAAIGVQSGRAVNLGALQSRVVLAQ
ncbi:MAG: right-handed parallel beta-helix repeat-containing protein [Gloeocapsa sp. UFS-A4-WI-NPMV-4B04]|jgi:parallel beta-helix repeat protein|nr:right-handed parallel beta-helix repeat-containing protein [Gloeocapsa sp. UFS-A4-WI-NPMV-4B04]